MPAFFDLLAPRSAPVAAAAVTAATAVATAAAAATAAAVAAATTAVATTATAVTAAARARALLLLRSCFVDGHRPAAVVLTIELVDRGLRFRVAAHLDE